MLQLVGFEFGGYEWNGWWLLLIAAVVIALVVWAAIRADDRAAALVIEGEAQAARNIRDAVKARADMAPAPVVNNAPMVQRLPDATSSKTSKPAARRPARKKAAKKVAKKRKR